ncbi:MAG: glycosidase, partial [Candidatus Limnocylindrales bacterium]
VMYHGVHLTAAGPINRVGFTLLELDDPPIVLRRSDEWVLGPATPYERLGDVDQVVFPCGWTVNPATDEMFLYYGAADTSVAVATAAFSDVLAYVDGCPQPERRRETDRGG